MTRPLIGMTVCSGIGAPELAAPWVDWRYQSEIDPFASAVLRERFPDATNLGDMTKYKDWPDATINVLCGGTPCQSFSVAGLRKGLADPRGNLALTYLAIAERYRPDWLVWENVPGVLSALSHAAPDPCPPNIDLDSGNGPRDGEAVVVTDEYRSIESHALWCFVAGAAELGYCGGFVSLDAQHVQTPGFPHAVPQRRDRVFFVGYLGDWRRAAAVLFDGACLSGNPPPRREAGQIAAPTLSARPTGGGGLGADFDLDGGLIASEHPYAGTVTSKWAKGSGGPAGDECQNLVAHTLRGNGFDAREDGTGRGTPIVPMAIQERASCENPNAGPGGAGFRQDGAAYTLEARTSSQAVAFDLNQITSKTNRSKPDPAVHHTLPATTTPPHLATPWAVRRLTPVECERLQGFPDGWTAIPWRGKPADLCPDGPRYKVLGNSWALNCGEYIFDRIKMVEEMAA